VRSIGETRKKLNRYFSSITSKNTYSVSVAIALILVSVLLVTYYVALQPKSEKYMTLYLLDNNRKTDYPELLVANANSTFTIFADVENHMGEKINNAQVLVKATKEFNSTFPVDSDVIQSYVGNVADGATWESTVTISLNETGKYSVIFELWIPNQTGDLQFSGTACVLNIQVSEN
jgi:uncharacterized membrane protein